MLRFTLALLLASLTACAIAATGLFYVPGAFTPLSEVVELQEVVAPFRGLHTSHMRDEAAGVVDAALDQYPYTASSTTIHAALLPKWALEGGLKDTIARIKDPALRPKMRAEVAEIIQTERGGGDPRNVAISLCEWDACLAGKNLADIAVSRGLAPTVSNAAEVVL